MPSLRRALREGGFRCKAVLPASPDRADDEALACAHRLPPRLALARAARQLRLCRWRMP